MTTRLKSARQFDKLIVDTRASEIEVSLETNEKITAAKLCCNGQDNEMNNTGLIYTLLKRLPKAVGAGCCFFQAHIR